MATIFAGVENVYRGRSQDLSSLWGPGTLILAQHLTVCGTWATDKLSVPVCLFLNGGK